MVRRNKLCQALTTQTVFVSQFNLLMVLIVFMGFIEMFTVLDTHFEHNSLGKHFVHNHDLKGNVTHLGKHSYLLSCYSNTVKSVC